MQENEIVRIISEYLESKRVHESKRMYNLNIIDELHANENAHTRILLKLFSYELDGKKIILEKFIDRINQKIKNPERAIKAAGNAKVFYQFAFMDGYIKSSDGWAIIIENKINWAADQENQIDRYIQSAIDDGIAENKIYVVYLTDNGAKKVSDYSFDKERNGNIGGFVELNYQDDILPLLKTTADELPEKEIVLTAAITQYTDYLEGRFGMRESEKKYNTAMNESLLKILNLSGTNAEKYEQIESLQWELWNRLDSLKHEVYPNQPNYIAWQLRDFLNEKREATVPFTDFKLVDGCCVISSNQNQIPLSNGNIGRVILYIVIKSETEFSLEIHTMQDENGWLDDVAVFEKAIMENEALRKYLTADYDFDNRHTCYVRSGNYKDITDLEETITNWIEELRKFF
mgnify:FL=1